MALAVAPAAAAQPNRPSAIKNGTVVVPQEIQTFWQNLWHVDVKKDHGPQTYDAVIVNQLLPGGNGGSDAGGKEGLFQTLIKDYNGSNWLGTAYDRFQSPTDEEIRTGKLGEGDKIKVADTNYTYKYKIFKRVTPTREGAEWNAEFTTLLNNIQAFLPTQQILRYTDTSRDGWQTLCAFPRLPAGSAAAGQPHLLHANTREVESDPASKLAMSSFDTNCKQMASNVYYYEKEGDNNKIIVYPKWQANVGSNSALSCFYCAKDVQLTLKKTMLTGKLTVELSYFDDNKKVDITEDMNKAGSFTKLLSNIKKFLNIKTAADLKKAIFISKHHGDIGQVLSPFMPRILTNVGNQTKISTDNYLSAFESYDVNPILKAFSVGEDIIWMHTSPAAGRPQCIIIFIRDDLLQQTQPQKVSLRMALETQLASETAKLNSHIEAFNGAVGAINRNRKKFLAYFNSCFREYSQADDAAAGDANTNPLIGKANAWRGTVKAETNINKRYGLILQRAAQFAVLAKNLPEADIAEVAAFAPPDFVATENVDNDIGTLQGIIGLISNKRKSIVFPKESLEFSQNIFIQAGAGAGDIQSVSIQKDVGLITDADYRSFTKKTMANMWSFVNLKNVRSRLAGIEPKFIAAYALKSIKLIVEGLSNVFTNDEIDLFKNFLSASVEDPIILERLNAGFEFLGIEGNEDADQARRATAAGRMLGGKRTRRQKGGNGKGGYATQVLTVGARNKTNKGGPAYTAYPGWMQRKEPKKPTYSPGGGTLGSSGIPVKFQVMRELLKDIRHYLTLVLDNLANPENIEEHLNEFLMNTYGIQLETIQQGGAIKKKSIKSRPGQEAPSINEDFYKITNPAPPDPAAAKVELTDLRGSFDKNLEEEELTQEEKQAELQSDADAEEGADQSIRFTTLTPIMGHIQDIIQNLCVTLNSAEARSRLRPQAHRDALYNLFFVIQQLNSILNLSEQPDDAPEEKKIDSILKAELAEIKAEITRTNYFTRCTIYQNVFHEALRNGLLQQLSIQSLDEIAKRLVLKHTRLGGLGEQGPAAERLFPREVTLERVRQGRNKAAIAAAKIAANLPASGGVAMPPEEHGIPFNNLPLDEQKRRLINPTNKAVDGKIREAYSKAVLKNPIVTWGVVLSIWPDGLPIELNFNEEMFAQGQIVDQFVKEKFNPAVYTQRGGRRKTQRRRKNENKKRRTTWSKHERRI